MISDSFRIQIFDKERFNFDFRIDNTVGERMQTDIPEHKRILDKLRQNIYSCDYFISDGQTGTFVAIDNCTVLHARDALPPIEIKNKLEDSKRLLFRSKGQKLQLLDLGNF